MVDTTNKGTVIWITGMSGAGKTTLCHAVSERMKPHIPELMLLDGDAVRELYGNDLDHRELSRKRQIERLHRLALFLTGQGQFVLVAALYSHPDLLVKNRATLPNYFEVYLNAPLALLQGRDGKGLYAGAAAGRIPNVVGVDIPWHAPARPDLVLDADAGLTPAQLAQALIAAVPGLRDRSPV
jgi:adenylylsulfate kinase-like enzyme